MKSLIFFPALLAIGGWPLLNGWQQNRDVVPYRDSSISGGQVRLLRPVGVSGSCGCQACQAVTGDRWWSTDGRLFERMADGGWAAVERTRMVSTSKPVIADNPQSQLDAEAVSEFPVDLAAADDTAAAIIAEVAPPAADVPPVGADASVDTPPGVVCENGVCRLTGQPTATVTYGPWRTVQTTTVRSAPTYRYTYGSGNGGVYGSAGYAVGAWRPLRRIGSRIAARRSARHARWSAGLAGRSMARGGCW